MTAWPIDIALPPVGQSARHTLYGELFELTRQSETLLELCQGEHERHRVGINQSATTLRFIPYPGELPLLNLLDPKVLCPAKTQLELVLTPCLNLRVGVGHEESFVHLTDVAPKRQGRALYGAVDTGVLCTSLKTPHYTSFEEADRAQRGESRLRFTVNGVATSREGAVAFTALRIVNTTPAPLEVSKVMLPLDMLGLYGASGRLYASRLAIKLLGPLEAQLEYLGPPAIERIKPLRDLYGAPMATSKKSFFFLHTYRTKTGLDFGF